MTFKDFWTNDNNPMLKEESSVLATRQLICWIVVIIAAVLLTIMLSKKSQKARQIVMYIFAGILLFFEIASRVVDLFITPNLTLEKVVKILLPLEICSVVVWAFIIAIFIKKQFMYEFCAIAGLFATTLFLLFPAVGINRTYMTFTCIYSTVSHMIGFICAILMMTFGYCKFEFKKIWHVYLCFAVMFLWGALFDLLIFPGSNYMYLVEDPLEAGMAFPYQITYGFIIALYILSFYVITFIRQKIAEKEKLKNAKMS